MSPVEGVRIDVLFPDSPEVFPLSDSAFRTIVEMAIYSHRYQTGGVIPEAAASAKWPEDALSELRTNHLDLDDNVYTIIGFDQFRAIRPPGRRAIPVEVRRTVMERDKYECVICGAQDELSLDHIIRYRDGGPDTVENLRVLCMPCNRRRR
ncbi:HNH endonuclease [Gordonia alkanivorans]|uniref:HNH endonuclease n=1 Tax=Gordonia alkanivorans TaxID=84096 RepID=UPI0024B70378|nr:HNH endonuclease [Gordonia alkanivorans]MDJ0010121.1 HNH endonuclease [Gordonia alkanivorans]MDJ0495689.1 HNH endonuclease [Gordonia alkanivorans]